MSSTNDYEREMFVTKRNGERKVVEFDKILRRIKVLGTEAGITMNYTSLTMKVIDQLFDGITTTQIDELSAEQCAVEIDRRRQLGDSDINVKAFHDFFLFNNSLMLQSGRTIWHCVRNNPPSGRESGRSAHRNWRCRSHVARHGGSSRDQPD